MAKTATAKRGSSASRSSSSKKRASAGSNGSSNGGAKSAAAKGAAKAAITTRPGGPVRAKMAGAAIKSFVKRAGDAASRAADGALPSIARAPAAALDRVRQAGWDRLTDGARKLPVQRSVDVAVPLDAAWDEWMRFEWLPESGGHVLDVERDGDTLFGQLDGRRARDWEAEITDERVDQSFAWQSVEGGDTSGLVTFHRLADRLTRIELQLDTVPGRMGEALSLVLHLADKRAEATLRGFKAQAEALDPDEYPPPAEVEDDGEEPSD
jgi:uncharacterized membrane protein